MIRSAHVIFLAASMGAVSFAQSAPSPAAPGPQGQAGAYYHFVMGRLYSELAAAEGNREYINQSIQNFRDALKLDPSAGIIYDELTQMYLETRRAADGATLAEDLLKENPDNLNAHRMLGRIYLQLASGNGRPQRASEEYLKKALEQFQILTQKDPKNADNWVTLGTLYDASNNSAEAQKALETALQLEPDNEDALTKMADVYAGMGDMAKAVQLLKQLAAKSPSERTFRELAGRLEENSDFKGAAEALRKALEYSPDDDRLQAGLADALLQSGQFDEALPVYQQLAKDNPKEAGYPLRISQCYRLKHDFTKAQEFLDQSKKLATRDDLEVRLEEVRLLADQAKTDQAIATLKEVLDETSKSRYSAVELRDRMGWLLQMVELQRKAKQYDQALETVKQMAALDSDPKDPTVVLTRSEVLVDQGKVDEGVTGVRTLLKNEKSDRVVYIEIAQLYERAKRWNDMAKALNSAEPLAETTKQKTEIYFLRGAMLERQKKFDAAEASFRKLLELSPDDAGALNYLGYMLADRNVKLDEAYRLVKRALDLEPDKGEYLDSLGWVFFRQGKLDEAAVQLQHALDRTEDATIHDHLGDVYAKLGKTTDAIAQWQASLREFKKTPDGDSDPEEVSKVNKKLDEAQAKLAKETRQR